MFQLLLTIHIITGTVCLITGLIAMLSKKKKGKHTRSGEIYHWSYVIVFVTAVVMSIIYWEKSAYLFYIALFSYSFALMGYLAVKKKWKNWLGSHIGGMLGSYIGIVTATIVVNIPRIPLLNQLPIIIFWLLPTIIGVPLITRVGKRYASKTGLT
ncbi:DUF2306 domain-containing protein [Lottiidibacillus patelloidae]|uniref:DUF2306 domain-containing protein n=1 Tax=Lottiidibacillus patelloidae TaxID=2670334 RepID=A0A263BSX8_9BACI|nr:DUF2306 domain-containing protein [Lottiidibacillus patelloidae]OZM56831.1 DUF2306 domain-containing protein [Lottiidibacillus patelloidae]